MSQFYFSPRTTQALLKGIRGNIYLARFFRCQTSISLSDLRLDDILRSAMQNFIQSQEWQRKKMTQLDIRIHGSQVDKRKFATDEFDEEVLYFIDILVTGGVKVGDIELN